MLVHLVVRNEGQAGKRIRVSEPFFVIGREEGCELRTKTRSVSRKHCVIVQKEDRVYIKDLDSRNGTILNDEKIAPGSGCRLYHRDKLQIGKLSFRLSVRDPVTDLPALRPVDPEETSISDFDTERFLSNTKFRSLKQDPLPKESEPEPEPESSTTTTQEFTAEELKESDSSESVAVEPKDPEQDENSKAASEPSGPKGLPEHLKKRTASSTDAAHDALKKFFTR